MMQRQQQYREPDSKAPRTRQHRRSENKRRKTTPSFDFDDTTLKVLFIEPQAFEAQRLGLFRQVEQPRRRYRLKPSRAPGKADAECWRCRLHVLPHHPLVIAAAKESLE
jgi:hypothetical protein